MNDAALWTSEEAEAATGGRCAAGWVAQGVSIDSRTLVAGDLFVALQGPNFDGHDFVADAFTRGAAAGVVSRAPDGEAETGPLLVVDDTMAALEALGAAARARTGARIVAVTGSVGKTGTKEALRLLLEAQGRAHASAGNLNNQWGAPLSLARMPRDSAFGVFELGMNHAGELGPLARLVRPHVAIVTTVEAVHLEFFESVHAIAAAKGEIFEGLEPDGAAILNRDNPHYELLEGAARRAGASRIIDFGGHVHAAARLLQVALHPGCCCISALLEGELVTYKVGVPGRHWVMNSLAVLAAVRALGADVGRAAIGLASLPALKGRGECHSVALGDGSFVIIDESYNASPAAMRAALATLARAEVGGNGRRIAVLGDMLELGTAAAELHAALAPDLMALGIDQVFTAGPNMEHLGEALPEARRGAHAPTSEALVPAIVAAAEPGDVVLVKGSLGSRMALVVEALLALDDERPSVVNG